MDYDGQAFEVEFANNDGTIYAIKIVLVNKIPNRSLLRGI